MRGRPRARARPERAGADDERGIDHGNPEPFLRKEHQTHDDSRRQQQPASPASVRVERRPEAAPRRRRRAGAASPYDTTRRERVARRVEPVGRADRHDEIEQSCALRAQASRADARGSRRAPRDSRSAPSVLRSGPGCAARSAWFARSSTSGFAAKSPSPLASGWLPVQNVTPPSDGDENERVRRARSCGRSTGRRARRADARMPRTQSRLPARTAARAPRGAAKNGMRRPHEHRDANARARDERRAHRAGQARRRACAIEAPRREPARAARRSPR